MASRVSPTDAIRARIDEVFAGDFDLGSALEQVARLSVQLAFQSVAEEIACEVLGRGRYERRSEEHLEGSRNGYQPPRTLKTTLGPVELRRPKLRGAKAPLLDQLFGTGVARTNALDEMLKRLPPAKRRRTLAGDKGYDVRAFVADVRELGITPHIAPNTTRQRSAIDGRTTRHVGHALSQRIRKRIEEPFGWMKTVADGRKLRCIGRRLNRARFLMAGAAYNIVRIAALDAAVT